MERQPLEIQTLYAELLERIAMLEAQRAIGHAQGAFVTKLVKGHTYYYFQHSEPGGVKRQTYIGKRDDALDAVVSSFDEARAEVAVERGSIDRLATLLRAGGAMMTDAPSARVLHGLAEAGVFRQGAVLVGTHAFVTLGNVLGVRWRGASLRTQDVDVAAGLHMSLAVPAATTDVPAALDSLEMGFVPVLSLNRKSPSTSFKVRGQALRVDLVTPGRVTGGKPIELPSLSAAAQPLKYLDYVMEDWISAAVINGGGVAVNIPDPARFALHKLIVASERPAAMQTKQQKDLWQAGQVLEVLLEDRPGDVVRAWDGLNERGAPWVRKVEGSLRSLASSDSGLVDRLRVIVGI